MGEHVGSPTWNGTWGMEEGAEWVVVEVEVVGHRGEELHGIAR